MLWEFIENVLCTLTNTCVSATFHFVGSSKKRLRERNRWMGTHKRRNRKYENQIAHINKKVVSFENTLRLLALTQSSLWSDYYIQPVYCERIQRIDSIHSVRLCWWYEMYGLQNVVCVRQTVKSNRSARLLSNTLGLTMYTCVDETTHWLLLTRSLCFLWQ